MALLDRTKIAAQREKPCAKKRRRVRLLHSGKAHAAKLGVIVPNPKSRAGHRTNTAHLYCTQHTDSHKLPRMPAPPWDKPRGVAAVTNRWLSEGKVKRCLAAERLIPPTEATMGPMPELPLPLLAALGRRGVAELYSHQTQAIGAARSGRHVIVSTPTASGKSLCFHLPVLAALSEDPSATALFLYPTKALSRDQEHGMLSMIRGAKISVPAIVFDGDTPGDARQKARERGRVILTNPDMLHAGILPNHTKWASFFQGLRYVVLDEMHTYRGVFGSHMAHVVTRLRRIAAFHGARPTFIGATATIGNPLEHASRLLGVPENEVELVDQSGAPQNSRKVFLYNPPLINEELGLRASTLKAAVFLAADLVKARVPTIIFGPSRNSVEVMLKYLRAKCEDDLKNAGRGADQAIMGYRGGYLPEMRRAIEKGLREGEILAVVATNALELGIDIGDLDAVVCAGYPGSVAGTWQRFGRAGRRGSQSVAVMVCGSGAVDQYLAREPTFLLESQAEHARIDPNNTEVLIQHLKCAAFEAPFEISASGTRPATPAEAEGEGYGTLDPASTRDALDYLKGHGLLHASGGRYHWAGEAFPASSVSLRNVGWDNFVIIDQGTPENPKETTIGELDYRATHTMLHEQAIYQQDAEQYQVERLDFENHKAYVRKIQPDYFTTALTYRTVSVLDTHSTRKGRSAISTEPPQTPFVEGWGDVKVLERVTGYKKIKFFTHENSGYGDVHLPEMEMHTTSYFLTVPEALIVAMGTPRALVVDALRGLGHALGTVASLALMCDPRDLNQTLGDGEQEVHLSPAGREPARIAEARGAAPRVGQLDPTLFLFDAQPGGVGLAERIFELSQVLISRAQTLISRCPCAQGCPACVGPAENSPRKRVSLELIAALGLGEVSATFTTTPTSQQTHLGAARAQDTRRLH